MIETAMNGLWNLASLIVVIGVLVTFHEWGHFFVARRAGIKVLKFSVGFGKPIFSWFGKDGVEYIIARIPLGGYVKMLDENEAEVAEEDLPGAFNRASVGKRIAVVSAGPLANFILAIFLFWITFMMGVTQLKPIIGKVIESSPASKAGLSEGMLIKSVGNEAVTSWNDVVLELVSFLGEQGELEIQVQYPGKTTISSHKLVIQKAIGSEDDENPLTTVGLTVFRLAASNRVGAVSKGSAADRAGIIVGDEITQINQHIIVNWDDLKLALVNQANKTVELKLQREGQWIDLKVRPEAKAGDDSGQGLLGVGASIDETYLKQREALLVTVNYGIWDSLIHAIDRTGKIFALNLNFVGKLISGHVSTKNLSGPVGIAQGAGRSASEGIRSFLSFLALISVSLGFLNLLPVPVLDGGHLLFYLVELVRGKPVPEAIQEFGMKIGIVLILTLTIVALFNDVSRF